MVALWKRTTIKIGCVLIPAMFFLMFLAEDVMVVLFSEKYLNSTAPFRVYLLMLILRCTPTDEIFIAYHKNHLILFRSFISLSLNLAMTIFLVQQLGYIGAAISTVLASLIWALPVTVILASRLTKQPISALYPFKKMGRILVAVAFASLILLLRPYLGGLPRIVALLVLFFPFLGVSIYLMKLVGVPEAYDLAKSMQTKVLAKLR